MKSAYLPILATSQGDFNRLGSLKATLDVILDFGSTLTKIRPGGRIVEIAVLVGTFRSPDDASGGTTGVKSGMRAVTLVCLPELLMDSGIELCDEVGSAFS